MQAQGVDYVHPKLHEEVAAIGGRYVLTQEVRVPFRGRELLYITGYAVVDTSCCGEGGCGYALVPGFILNWKYTTNPDGLPVSRAEVIRDEEVQKDIRRFIAQQETVNQVMFQ